MLNGKVMIICLIVGQIKKKDIVKTSQCFPETKSLGRKVKVELDLYNNATKTFFLIFFIDLASLKSNLDKFDIDKLKQYSN